jgi:hypothetical protein
MKAAGDGDFTMLRALVAAMPADKTHGWEQMLQLGEISLKDVKKQFDERSAKDREAIYKAAGGEENWKQVQAWANQHAEPAEREGINAALKGGGVAAKAMAAWLTQCYSAASAGQPQEPRPVTRDGAPPLLVPAIGSGPLSPVQFSEARNALIEKLGTSYIDGHPEYIALTNRRRAWRG